MYETMDEFNRHHWNTTVRIGTLFEAEIEHVPGITAEYVRTVTFNIPWSAFVSDSGIFSHESVGDITFSDSIMQRVNDALLQEFGFPTLLQRFNQVVRRGTKESI